MRFLACVCAVAVTVAFPSQDDNDVLQSKRYDVRDLLEAKTALNGDILADLIEDVIGWRVPLPQDGFLIIRANANDQASIRKTLDRVRQGNEPIVAITVRILESRLDLRPAKSESLVARLKVEESARVEDQVKKEPGRVMNCPRISVFERQPGTVIDGEEISYVSSWNVRIGTDGKANPDPVLSCARIGTCVTIVPSVKDHALSFDSIGITIAESNAKPPAARQIKTPHGIIEDPEIRMVQYDLSSPIGEKESLLIGPLLSPLGGDEKLKTWLVIKGEVVRGNK